MIALQRPFQPRNWFASGESVAEREAARLNELRSDPLRSRPRQAPRKSKSGYVQGF